MWLSVSWRIAAFRAEHEFRRGSPITAYLLRDLGQPIEELVDDRFHTRVWRWLDRVDEPLSRAPGRRSFSRLDGASWAQRVVGPDLPPLRLGKRG